jgi:maleylacetate reductase
MRGNPDPALTGVQHEQAVQPLRDHRVRAFDYLGQPARVLFGPGRRSEVAQELGRLSCTRPFVVCTSGQRHIAQRIAAAIPDATLYAQAVMHTPVAVTEQALALAREQRCDGLVAVGGGSAIGLSKALALRTDWPQVVLPTTYAGSEVTSILGETREGRKTTQRSARVLPEVAIYDVELTLSLPAQVSAASGMNAIAHAVEALYARDTNPVVSMWATAGIAALARSLARIAAQPADVEARADAQCGGWLCGMCLGSAGMALHHKLCHVLGGAFDLPHAETHAVLLPYTAAYNARAAPRAMAQVAQALGTANAVLGLHALVRALPLPTSLRTLGMPEDGLGLAVELALRDAYWNPRPLDAAGIRAMLAAALDGRLPVAQ